MSRSGISSFSAFLGAVLFYTAASAQLLLGAGDGIKPSGGAPPGGDCSGTGTIATDAVACFSNNDCLSPSFSGTASSATWNFTVTGSNPVLLVYVTLYNGSAPTVTGITYNSVALTKVDSITAALEGNNQDTEMWVLKAPSTGTHSIVASFSGTIDFYAAGAESYTGVNQTSPINAHSTGQNTSAGTSFSQAVTSTGGNNCWITGIMWDRSATPGSGAGTTLRGEFGGYGSFANSNATVTAGSHSLAWTFGSSTVPGSVVAALSPAP